MSEKENLTSEAYIEKALSEMLKEEMDKVPEVHIDPDELEALAEEDKARRRKRFMKYASVAAVFVLVCVTVLFTMWPGSAVPADADKDKEITIVKDGKYVIVDDGSSGNEGTIYQDWDQVRKLKSKERGICIPEYVPSNFELEQCILDKTSEKTFNVSYSFKGKDNHYMFIKQVKANSSASYTTGFKDEGEYLETTKGVVSLYSEKTQSKAFISLSDNSFISITTIGYKLSDQECKKIVEGIKI